MYDCEFIRHIHTTHVERRCTRDVPLTSHVYITYMNVNSHDTFMSLISTWMHMRCREWVMFISHIWMWIRTTHSYHTCECECSRDAVNESCLYHIYMNVNSHDTFIFTCECACTRNAPRLSHVYITYIWMWNHTTHSYHTYERECTRDAANESCLYQAYECEFTRHIHIVHMNMNTHEMCSKRVTFISHIYECEFTRHIRILNIYLTNEYECTRDVQQMSRVTHMQDSCHTYEWIWINTYEWAHIWIHMNVLIGMNVNAQNTPRKKKNPWTPSHMSHIKRMRESLTHIIVSAHAMRHEWVTCITHTWRWIRTTHSCHIYESHSYMWCPLLTCPFAYQRPARHTHFLKRPTKETYKRRVCRSLL